MNENLEPKKVNLDKALTKIVSSNLVKRKKKELEEANLKKRKMREQEQKAIKLIESIPHLFIKEAKERNIESVDALKYIKIEAYVYYKYEDKYDKCFLRKLRNLIKKKPYDNIELSLKCEMRWVSVTNTLDYDRSDELRYTYYIIAKLN